jgi:GNAT superfamily N-acetyltransferase
MDIAISHVHRLIKDPTCVVLVLYNENEPVGFMGVTIFSSPISDTRMANEHLWYVKPEFRGAKAVLMLDAAISWAKRQGCSHFLGNASMLASNLHDTVCKIYDGYKMKKFETTYIKTLEV